MVNKFIKAIEAPNPEGFSSKEMLLANEDLKPVEEERRLWRSFNYAAFWVSDGFNLNTWYIASAIIATGLNWWQAWLSIIIGYTLTGIAVAVTARIGAVYHIGYPVVVRSSFGIFGSLWPVLNRAAMACVWTGVQSWIGGQCVTILLRSLAPSYNNIANGIPGSGTTTRDFVSFFIFWLIQLPLIYPSVQSIRHLFTVKTIVAPIAGIAYMAWVIAKAGGGGEIIRQPATVSGSDLGWSFVGGVMSSIANFATLICNAPDFSRFARRPKNALVPQVIAIPVTFSLVSLVGIFVASSSTVIYGEALWDPLALLNRFLDDDPYKASTRAGCFFISAAFILAQIGVNIAANTISAGSDLTALLPRFMTIRRGGYVAAIVALCMCPWHLLSSSSMFTTYLSAYSVFLSSIIGVMWTDYYVARRGHFVVAELYSFDKRGRSWYTAGIHWRAYVAYICGIIPNAPGFGNAVGSTSFNAGVYIYRLNFFVGFIVSGLIYWVLTLISPIPGTHKQGWHEDLNFEPSRSWLSEQTGLGGRRDDSMDYAVDDKLTEKDDGVHTAVLEA